MSDPENIYVQQVPDDYMASNGKGRATKVGPRAAGSVRSGRDTSAGRVWSAGSHGQAGYGQQGHGQAGHG